MIRPFLQQNPKIHPLAWVDDMALVIGDVHLDAEVNVWPMAVIRGDVNKIRIGARTNVQDGAVLHVSHVSDYSPGAALIIGEDVTIGHNAILHGCKIGNACLIGMGATVLDNAVLEDEVMVGANALVAAGKTLESGYLYLGSPAKKVRPLSESEKSFLKYSAAHYVKLAQAHQQGAATN